MAETERDRHRVDFNRSFADAGLPWRWDERLYGELLAVTGGRERIAYYAQRFAPDWLTSPDVPRRIAELHSRKNAHYAAIAEARELHLRPGLAAMQCIAIEDSANGLRSAPGAVIKTVIVRSLYTQAADFSTALAVLDGNADDHAAAGDARLLTAGFVAALS